MIINNSEFMILGSSKKGNAIFHNILEIGDNFDISNYCKVGQKATIKLNISRRIHIMRNHTATHLLHQALQQVLGKHIQQAGSFVSDEYLRFDFNHFEKLNKEQLKLIEIIVNSKIKDCLPVETKILSIEEAKQKPEIKMFFGDKYGDEVRAVFIGDFSAELCGGTHCKNTSEISAFKIISESSVAAGIRRIEAITGQASLDYIYKLEEEIENKNKEIDELKSQIKHYEKIEEKIKKAKLVSEVISTAGAKKVNGIRVFVTQMELENLDQLRTAAEKARETGHSGICLIASVIENKVQLACSVSDDLKEKYPAGKLVGDAAKILGGGGGGKPHLATAGGKNISKLDELLSTEFYKIIESI
jgi:alanyl-tRNA synthetase